MKLPNFSLFKREFVSLVITQRELKAIKVNTKSNKVVKFAQVEVPPGVIVNYRVKQNEVLVKLIKDLWVKNGIKDRYVGVVVPEFSTYTKSLVLPNLTDVEINEALTFRVQEFLPTDVSEVVYDWKIAKREKDKAHVLVVAILKDVLFGYIDAVGAAGLFPLVVETPALSVQRMVDKDASGKLIVYMNKAGAILVIASEGEVVASSVVNSDNMNIIVTTARQMLAHYSNISVERVTVGGVGITQDLVEFLNYNLGRPVSLAEAKVSGLLPGQVQDFLVGISLQYKDPAEPASETTVNLLPPSWAERYKSQSAGIRAWSLTLIASIIIWSTFLFVFMVFMFMSIQEQNLSANGSGDKRQELNNIVAQVNEINSLASAVVDFENKTVYPSTILNLLARARTEGVSLSYYKVNYTTGEIILRGLAETRASLLAFKNSLEEVAELGEVALPVSSLVQGENINFEVRTVYSSFVKEKRAPAKLKI